MVFNDVLVTWTACRLKVELCDNVDELPKELKWEKRCEKRQKKGGNGRNFEKEARKLFFWYISKGNVVCVSNYIVWWVFGRKKRTFEEIARLGRRESLSTTPLSRGRPLAAATARHRQRPRIFYLILCPNHLSRLNRINELRALV